MCQGAMWTGRPGRSIARDDVMLSLSKLQGLRDVFVHLSRDRNVEGHAAEERRLERLAMGKKYHLTEEELKAWEVQNVPRRLEEG
jgi:hypothetical protein